MTRDAQEIQRLREIHALEFEPLPKALTPEAENHRLRCEIRNARLVAGDYARQRDEIEAAFAKYRRYHDNRGQGQLIIAAVGAIVGIATAVWGGR